eukprot:gene6568-6796_t
MLPLPASPLAQDTCLDAILRRVSRVVLPLCFVAGVFNYLDRTNLSFAALELNADLGLSAVDFGVGSGLFYLTYGLGMVPSTFMTMKYGALWYGFITIAWGIISTCSALMANRAGLFVLRMLLGLAEGGFITSAFHLLSQFYPKDRIGKPYAFVAISWQLSSVFAAPLAAGIMKLGNVSGLGGWQWLFILEGIPSVLVHGQDADAARQPVQWRQLWVLVWEAGRRPVLWYLIFGSFLWGEDEIDATLAMFSLVSWLPLIIKSMLVGTAPSQVTSAGGGSSGASGVNTTAALLSGIPYLCAACTSVIVAWSSDRQANLKVKDLHIIIPCTIAGVVLACFTPLNKASFAAGFVALVIAMSGAYAGQGLMFARVAVAAALGGLGGPALVGALVQKMGSFSYATIVTGTCLATCGVLVFFLRWVEAWEKRRFKRWHEQQVEMPSSVKQHHQESDIEISQHAAVGKDV